MTSGSRRGGALAVSAGSIDRHLQALGAQVRGQLPAEPAVSAQTPSGRPSAVARRAGSSAPGPPSNQVSSW